MSIVKKMRLRLLAEEEEDDEILMLMLLRKRKAVNKIYKTREEEGCFRILIERHLKRDEDLFKKYCRLNYSQFKMVLSLVADDLKPRTLRMSLSAQQKLFLTLRFLATGESFRSLALTYRISPSYISVIVKKTLPILSKKLVPIFMPNPTEAYFKQISDEFWTQWDFPNCVGAIDGKHVRIRCPNNSGSLYFNYKQYFSVVLLALVSANYRFIAVDIGSYGKEGDSGIFKKSALGKKIATRQFNIPEDTYLPGTDVSSPYVIVGDEAFGLDTYMMKPYSRNDSKNCSKKTIFNYRLCRARRVTENAFAILTQVFRVFYTPICCLPETCDYLISVACCLHNLLRDGYLQNSTSRYVRCDNSDPPTQNMIAFDRRGGYANANGFVVRDKFMEYFSCPAGQVPWQENFVNRVC